MKTLLFSTDFSANAKHAAEYGYRLAKQIKANIVLCNAVTVPAEVPQAGVVVWPMEESEVLLDDSTNELQRLKAHLEQNDHSVSFRPAIGYANGAGTVTDVVEHITANRQIDLVVMGTHASDSLSTFLLGDHSKKMIDSAIQPLLLIPPEAAFAPIKKIAFATDFKQLDVDMAAIYTLIPMVRALNAEILLTNVYDEKNHSHEFQRLINRFLLELSNKADYPHIYYRLIKNSRTETGLDWLCEHGHVDILAMVHHSHNFFYNILTGSYTKKMAGHIPIPLLVFPARP
jgi:nucleotide-binding universal stress UspA family protein